MRISHLVRTIVRSTAAALLLLSFGMHQAARASRMIRVTVTPDNIFHDIQPSFVDSLRLHSVASKLKTMNAKSQSRLRAAIEHEYSRRGSSCAVEARKRRHYLALAEHAPSGLSMRLKYITGSVCTSEGRLLLGYTIAGGKRWVMLIDAATGKPIRKLDVTPLATDTALEILAKYASRKWTTLIKPEQVCQAPEVDLAEALQVVKRSSKLGKALNSRRFHGDADYDRLYLRVLAGLDRTLLAAHR